MEGTEMKHFTHEHALTFFDTSAKGPQCNMCSRKIYKDCYVCLACLGWFIHKECAKLPEHINHSLHPQHSLSLAKRSLNNNSRCFYCEYPFEHDEYVYSCDPLCSNFYMHMKCALIPMPIMTSDVDGREDHSVVQYACHQQPMALVEHLDDRNKREAKCFACQSNWSAPAYSCTSKMCRNFVHKSCTKIPRKIRHAFHSHHFLVLQVSRPRSCRCCCKRNCRVIYSCHEDGCDFILCTECLSSKTIVRSRSHDHSLSLVEKSSCEIPCDACQKSYHKNRFEVLPEEINRTRSVMFRCMDCVFNLHFLCGPLPSTIKYEGHMHALILSDHSAIEDGSDEYYCDACEEKCDQASRVYYCEKCKYGAHIHCLMHEIMTVIKGDTEDVELQTLGENRWYRLGNESKECDEAENGLTLKDIMDELTQAEKEILINPFGYSDDLKARRRSTYEFFRSEVNSFLDPKETCHQIFGSGSGAIFYAIIREMSFFTPEEGLLKLEDKYLRQKVEDVDGYMVPKTLAPILRTMLLKYGDLGGHKSLSPTLRSVTSTLLCIVIDKLCKTEVEDITRDDLKYLSFYLKGISAITNSEKIDMYLGSLNVLTQVFLGFKAIRCEDDIQAQLGRKIVMLMAELKACMKNREKLKLDSPTTTGFMKQCATQASKWKGKKWGDNWF